MPWEKVGIRQEDIEVHRDLRRPDRVTIPGDTAVQIGQRLVRSTPVPLGPEPREPIAPALQRMHGALQVMIIRLLRRSLGRRGKELLIPAVLIGAGWLPAQREEL